MNRPATIQAVLALLAGAALFFSGCGGPEGPAARKTPPPVRDELSTAEAFVQRGELDKALAAFEAYAVQQPAPPRRAYALHRMAQIRMDRGEQEAALPVYRELASDYPAYSNAATSQYEYAALLCLTGAYEQSRQIAQEWLADHPGHGLTGEVLVVLGRDHHALGEDVAAFAAWQKAKQTYLVHDPRMQEELARRLETLIRESDPKALQEMARTAEDDALAARIYEMTARLYLEQGELPAAGEAVEHMLAVAQESEMVERGEALRARIRSDLSVDPEVVGCLLPLTGPFAAYGEEALNGILLGLGDISDARNPIQLVIRDTRADAETAGRALAELIETEHAVAVIGPLTSRAGEAAARRAHELRVPLITLSQKEGIAETGGMVFRNMLTPSQEVTQILDLALGQWRLTRFALLYPDNPYGRYFAESFQEQCEAMGGSIPASSSYNPDHTDFAEAIRRLAPEKAPETVVDPDTGETRRIVRPVIRFDALFIPDNPARISMIAPQLIYHDILDVQLLGTSLWQSPALLRETGDYIQGAVFPSRFFARARLRAVTEFVETYRRGFETDPTALAAAGYETMTLLKEILLERGVQTRDALRTALQTLTFQGLTGPMAFDARGNIRKSPLFLTVSGSDIGVLPFPQEAENPPAAE